MVFMKHIMRFGLLLIAVSAFVSAHHFAFAQKVQTAQSNIAALNSTTGTSSQNFTEAYGSGSQRHGTTIHVRKYKPRSTQPTRITDGLTMRTESSREHTPEFSDRRTMRLLIVKSGLIVPVTDLKHLHSMNDRKIFSSFNQYKNIFTA